MTQERSSMQTVHGALERNLQLAVECFVNVVGHQLEKGKKIVLYYCSYSSEYC